MAGEPLPPEALAVLAPVAARLAGAVAALPAGLPPDAPAAVAEKFAKLAAATETFVAAVQPGSPPRSRHDLGNLLAGVTNPAQLLKRKHPTAGLDEVMALGWEARHGLFPPAEPTTAPTAAPTAAAAIPQPPPADDRPKVLLVDDDYDARQVIREIVGDLGCEVWEAADGGQAIQLATKLDLDLVLLDLDLPVADGLTVLRAMREGETRNQVPVLMVSGEGEVGKIAACLRAGANDFLTKPVDHDLLRVKVQANIDTRRNHLRLMEKFFPPMIARRLVDNPALVDEARDAEVSVLFCDIRGFSSLSEKLGTVRTLQLVRDTMAVLTESVAAYQGVVVDFVGDGMMAMWGAPSSQPDHAKLACRAALEMLRRLPGLNARWHARLPVPVEYTIGINTGVAQVGNTGTAERFKYGVLGNVVNIASRVQGATKYLKTRLVVTQPTLDRVDDEFDYRRLSQVRAVNIGEALQLYEIVPRGEPGWAAKKADYEAALNHYEARELDAAAKLLSRVISAQEVVAGPELALMARTMEALISRDRWSAVTELPGK